MQLSKFLKIKKPSHNDFVSLKIFNDNTDIIDKGIETVSIQVKEFINTINIDINLLNKNYSKLFKNNTEIKNSINNLDFKINNIDTENKKTITYINKALSNLQNSNIKNLTSEIISLKNENKKLQASINQKNADILKLINQKNTEILNLINNKTQALFNVQLDPNNFVKNENGYKIKIYNSIFTSNDIVNVNFNQSSCKHAQKSQIKSYVNSFNGYIEIYSNSIPQQSLNADILINNF